MTPRLELRCARAHESSDCLHERLTPLVPDRPAIVLYGTLNGIYLDDLGDRPGMVDEWDEADESWLDAARSAYAAISRTAGPTPSRLTRGGRAWRVEIETEIPRDMLSSLASFGTDAVVWTSLPETSLRLSDSQVREILERAPWWIAHGYKEPFLVIGGRESLDSVAIELGAVTDQGCFHPHRVRAHRSNRGQ